MNDKISRILDIPIEITVVLGRTKMTLNEVLDLGKGSLIELDTLENQEVEVLVNGKKIAYGQVVIAQQNFEAEMSRIKRELKTNRDSRIEQHPEDFKPQPAFESKKMEEKPPSAQTAPPQRTGKRVVRKQVPMPVK